VITGASNFPQSLIIMTSNLGAREMSELMEGHIGFAQPSDT
jgi:ATP-dependent Clp protease ATP-binding subunit ClpA